MKCVFGGAKPRPIYSYSPCQTLHSDFSTTIAPFTVNKIRQTAFITEVPARAGASCDDIPWFEPDAACLPAGRRSVDPLDPRKNSQL